MKKNEYLNLAIQSSAYKRKDWMISAFSVISESPDAYKANPYVYRIVQTVTGIFFIDPANEYNLTKIDDAVPNTPLFQFRDPFTVTPEIYPYLKEPIESTIGNLLFNLCSIAAAFGGKIPYVTGPVNIRSIEDKVSLVLTDNVAPELRLPDKIYVDEYIKFVDSMAYLKGWSQLCIQGATYKTLTAPPGIAKFKKELLEKHKGHLDDPTVLAEIDKALIAFDAEYLKGDPGGEHYANNKKARTVVRKKLYLMLGAEEGIVTSNKVDPSFNSLEEGWDVKSLPALNNALRAASFNRGSQTQLGGLLTKQILRATSNLTMTIDDCGTKVGITRFVTETYAAKLVGINIIVKGQSVLVKDLLQAKSYVGQTILKRSPMYCKAAKTDICKACLGDLLSRNELGLSSALSDYGSAILTLFLKKAHGGSLVLVKLDRNNFLS